MGLFRIMTLALAATSMVAAVPTAEPGTSVADSPDAALKRPGAGYAQFCDDLNCNKNCGAAVNIAGGKDMCFGENGRKSIFFGGEVFDYTFFTYPEKGCKGKRRCMNPIPAGCLALNGQSYGKHFGSIDVTC